MGGKTLITLFLRNLSHAFGRFEWVCHQLDYLANCLREEDVRHFLDELPLACSLDETYERALQEIAPPNWEFVRWLLQCVAVASRPLHVDELAEFFTFNFHAGPVPQFREDWRSKHSLSGVLSSYSSLVSVVKIGKSDIVQFPHIALRDFLTSNRFTEKCDSLSENFHISMIGAHTLVARACLGMLLHLNTTITRHSLAKFPLAEYAARHWAYHACFEGVSQTMEVEEGVKQLFDPTKPHFTIWTWIYDPIHPRTQCEQGEIPSSSSRNPLHYAAFLGLRAVVEFLVTEHSEDVDSQDIDDKSTPLHLASGAGHVEVAHFLVEHRASITVRDKDGLTPLHWASLQGRVEVTCLLIEYDADVGIQDKAGLTPLHWAYRQGRGDVARILISCGADRTIKDKFGLTPLAWASQQGRVDLAYFLASYGTGATVQDQDGSASAMAPWQEISAAELMTGERPLTVNPQLGPKTSSRGTRARNGDTGGQADLQGIWRKLSAIAGRVVTRCAR